MLGLTVVILAGLLIVDVCLDTLHRLGTWERRRQADRDRAAMRRTIERTGGRRP